MRTTGIYKISNSVNKVYIGQSINIPYRFKQYKNPNSCSTQTKLRNSINKYGLNNHKFEIVEECMIEELNDRERYWQDFYDCFKNGLNCRLTTSSDKSGEVSQETKDRTSKSNTGKTCKKETKDKIRIANTGRTYGIEVRNKVSKNNARWNAGLTDDEVHDICKMYVSGKTTREVNEKYPNVHYCTLSEIRRKKRYKHVSNLYNINKPSKKGCERKTIRKVICIEDNLRFDGICNAAEHYNVSFKVISNSALKNSMVRKINKHFKYDR